MMEQHRNIEIKARLREDQLADPNDARLGEFQGILEQTDTYFKTDRGRLKLREEWNGSVGRAELIAYDRPDAAGPKPSDVQRTPVTDVGHTVATLTCTRDVIKTVVKTRRLYIITNAAAETQTRVHVDTVAGLGRFLELEVVFPAKEDCAARGTAEAKRILATFGIAEDALIAGSYADM